jgi:hypothetical protein
MIYESVNVEDPISQGDIFRNVPRVDFSLETMAVVEEDEEKIELHHTSWRDALEDATPTKPIPVVMTIKPVTAIVITQNCDAVRGEYLCLCEIGEYLSTTGQKEPRNADKWQSLILKFSRSNSRYFYLPEDAQRGFTERNIVDFRVILRMPRVDLEGLKDHRIAKLNKEANEHFREALAHFFRRYAYNEWYPLTKEEFAAYAADCPEPVAPYLWQRESADGGDGET